MKKQSFLLTFFLVLLFSCNKEPIQNKMDVSPVEKIKAYLKDGLSKEDFQQLDMNKISICSYSNRTKIAQVPLINTNFTENFVALKISGGGEIEVAKIIGVNLNSIEGSNNRLGSISNNGHISIQTLKREPVFNSTIINGYISTLHKKETISNLKDGDPYVDLPVVVVVGYYPPSGGMFYSTLYNLSEMLGGSNSGGNYYQDLSGGGGGGDATYASTEPIKIDYESVEDNPAIDIAKYLKCFETLADVGSICSIKILTDIPVNGDPSKFFDWTNSSPGHTFLQFTKTNAGNSIQQYFGFYPEAGWKTIASTAPVKGKFADNQGHEFNASLTMNITPDKFRSALNKIAYLSRFIQYDIDEYNCTDFALEVFNSVRAGNYLEIPMYDIPGGTAINGTATPQGLYQKLVSMSSSAGSESKNITIPGVMGFAGNSNGPCN